MLPLLLAASLWAREADAQTVQPSVSFTQDSYPVWENVGTVTVTVKLASTRSTSTTVRISATQNTATAGSDFVGFTDVDLSIPAGGLTASRTIQIFNDTAYENGDWPRGGVADGEEFFVSVVSVNGDTSLGGAETKVVIADDEYTACFHAKTYLVGEGAGVYSLALRLSRQLPFPVKVTNAVVDYLSTEGVDYEVLKGTHTFKPGSQDGAFEIWIKDDKDVETNELFRITALVPSVPDGEVFCSTDIIIQENDVAPRTVSLIEQGARKGQDIIEGANGALGPAHFAAVEVSAHGGAQITNGADYVVEVCATSTTATRSADNTHTAGEDFVVQNADSGLALANGCYSTDLSANLSKAAKNASSALQIKAFGDTVHEEPETITVTLALKSNPGGLLQLGTSTLTYTIRDNSPIVTISGGGAVTEGEKSKFKIHIGGAFTSRINVSYTVSKVEGDFVDPQLLVPRLAGIFPGRVETDYLEVQTHDDNVYEPDGGLIKITLNPGTGYYVGDPASVTNEVNDNDSDDRPVVTISGGPAVTEGAQSKFKIHIGGAFTSRINVSYTASKVEGDFVDPQLLVPRLAGIFPGTTETDYFTVQTHDDNVYEPDGGLIKITLNPGTGYLVGDPSSVTNKVNDNDESNAFSYSCSASPLRGFTNTADLVIEENRRHVRVIKYPENGRYGVNCVGVPFDIPTTTTIPTPTGVTGKFEFESYAKAISIPGWKDDKFTGDRCGAVFTMGGHKYQLCVIDDENIPPASTTFKLLDGGRSISLNEGQEATHKVVIGKPVAQTALPCFVWGELSVVRDILFDGGRALDSNGCMKEWPGTPHVGNVIMDLYINTNDDDVVQADPQFTIGLKNTRKDGSSEPAHGSQTIEVTVVNDDHTDEVVVHPHPGPMAWVEVKEFFDSLSATDEDRKFSDGTFCNAETPGTRTVTAPGGSGATRTCVKYFARHATHLKWTTGRGTNFNYDIWATRRGNADSRVASIPAGSSYRSGEWPLPSDFRCNDAEARAKSVTVTVRDTVGPGVVGAERSNPPIHSTSRSFRNCADQLPGREYNPAAELPQGVRNEPPPDVDQYPATEWAYPELPRDEIVVAESIPYVDIRNARKTKFVKEGRRARFFVELSGEATQDVAVEWRVRPSVEHPRATLGEDVEKASGTLVIAQGETRGEIRVKTYEDSHDDDREKFRVRITSAEGAVIRQQRAHAIIRNDDPMPAAWLARFGRTVAEQALDGIAGRMAAPRTAGMQGTLAGQALSFDAPANDNPGSRGAGFGHAAFEGTGSPALADVAQAFGGQSGHSGPGGLGHDAAGFANGTQSRGMTGREALLGSSFSLTGEADGSGGSMAFWGRAAQGSFDGREGTFSLDGAVTTGMLGADYARGKWLVGLALAQSAGEGDYRDTGVSPRPEGQTCPADAEDGHPCNGAVRAGDGSVEASLTAAIPYAALQASERLKLWGAAGYGTGEVTLKTAMGGSYKADTAWSMAAAGLRGDLLEAPAEGSGPALALTSDALWARTSSEKTRDLAASDSDATRLRLGLEGSYRFAMEGGGHLTPKLEVGARHDGGDAETGFGVELGGGIAWVDPGLGLSLDVSGRTLIAHGDDDLKDRGYAASLAFDPDPATQRGPSLSLRQEFGGQAQGGLDALFQPAALEDRTGGEATSRWAMEAAYGFPAFGGRWTGSPHVGLGLATAARDYSLGWRLTPEGRTAANVSFGLKATRRESAAQTPEHTVGFEITARW